MVDRKKSPTLFDTTPRTTRAGVPAWVISALVKYGMSYADARRLPVRSAFARLADLKREAARGVNQPKLTPRERRERAFLRARQALDDGDEYTADELTDVIVEVLAPIGPIELRRVLAGLAALLRHEEDAKPAAGA